MQVTHTCAQLCATTRHMTVVIGWSVLVGHVGTHSNQPQLSCGELWHKVVHKCVSLALLIK